ncbi:hypothetical protein [Aquibacillus saliphilus]|uniref:hypothetical protein n=1 Tax=Aquibacillus saliphilus TaxID=1909422 RepID=UPI001CEFB83F|nr:hypothetical protein [Aquibacillus saliphilus]
MDSLDWELPGVDYILSTSRNHIRNGSILIFHDGYGDKIANNRSCSKHLLLTS